MPNHIHFLIRTRKESKLNQLEKISTYKNIELYISKQFSNLFSSYTQAFNNKVNQRRGNLFISNFQRKIVDNEIYLDNLIFNIHNNPVHHNFVSKIEDWKYSSYQIYIFDQDTFLEKEFVNNIFSNKNNFIEFHQNKQEFDKISQLIIE
jgi:REP element-mobilizing transposase RayT